MGKHGGKGHKGTGAGFRDGRFGLQVDRYERLLLRKGQHNKKERDILLNRRLKQKGGAGRWASELEERQQPTAPALLDIGISQQDDEEEVLLRRLAAKPATRETRVAEAMARGLSGKGVDEEHMLRRLARVREAEQAAKDEAAAKAVTPAAASLLADLRSQILKQ